ncbi:MAG TPA: MBL fold metallo-hydrolase [Paenibacillaceae bacterium]|nr:MBL fold metallo-hydrolase [Paenibacillaceae bacterium]
MQMNHEKTVYQLAFLPRIFPVNCYIVEEEYELTLIDTGLPYSWKGILHAARKIGKPITKILLTHGHEDHIGSLDRLKEILPNVPVYVSKRDARLMSGDRSLDDTEPNTPIRGGVPKKLKTRADILLQDGDQIGSLLAISTPGHTPGSMCFMDTRNNALIVGDTMQTRGGFAIAGQIRPFFPFPALATWNKQETIKSVRKLLTFQPSLIAAGHGKMLLNPGETIENTLAKTQEKIPTQRSNDYVTKNRP